MIIHSYITHHNNWALTVFLFLVFSTTDLNAGYFNSSSQDKMPFGPRGEITEFNTFKLFETACLNTSSPKEYMIKQSQLPKWKIRHDDIIEMAKGRKADRYTIAGPHGNATVQLEFLKSLEASDKSLACSLYYNELNYNAIANVLYRLLGEPDSSMRALNPTWNVNNGLNVTWEVREAQFYGPFRVISHLFDQDKQSGSGVFYTSLIP